MLGVHEELKKASVYIFKQSLLFLLGIATMSTIHTSHIENKCTLLEYCMEQTICELIDHQVKSGRLFMVFPVLT